MTLRTTQLSGQLKLTWTNKDLPLLTDTRGGYQWVPKHDYRVEEVRLLHDVRCVGKVSSIRASDNLLIHGDALHALHSLARLPEFTTEIAGQVRLAYIDPPFNSQQAFKQYDDALEHSAWLGLMRDRLDQVKRLLAPNGSIWVHCDDEEQAYLRVTMDEVFGRDCFAGTIVWRSSDNSNNDAKQFSTDHNYLHVYAATPEWRANKRAPLLTELTHFQNPDSDPDGPWFDGNPVNSPNPRENLRYTIVTPSGNQIAPPPNGWRWSRETLAEKMESGEVRFSENETRIIRRTYFKDHAGLPASSLWVDLLETGHNRQAKSELRRLNPGVPTSDLFTTPKPERLVQRIIEIGSDPGDTVLDCFLGSGTTAAVAHKLGRRWIGVEQELATIEDYIEPRLAKVVNGEDRGGASEAVAWAGGGGFRMLEVAPSMYEEVGERVVLSDWATGSQLTEAVAAQFEYAYELNPPFAGRKGRSQLAVIDGLVDANAVKLLLPFLADNETLLVCGTALDESVHTLLQDRRPGSVAERIPDSTLARYQRRIKRSRRWERTHG